MRKTVLIILLSVLGLSFSGCGDKNPQVIHPCLELEKKTQVAKGKTEQEANIAKQGYEYQRRGCQAGAQFSNAMAMTLFSSEVPIFPEVLSRYGKHYCENLPKQLLKKEARSMGARNFEKDVVEGCLEGSEQSVEKSPLITKLYQPEGRPQASPGLATDPKVDAAYAQARQMVDRMAVKTRNLDEAIHKLNRRQQALNARDYAQSRLSSAKSQDVAAKARHDLLHADSAGIFSRRDAARADETDALQALNVVKTRVRPREEEYQRAKAREHEAQFAETLASTRLAEIKAGIESAKSRAKSNNQEADRLFKKAKELDSE
ncbi:MAG: hypothetical protein AB1540_00070 [Bdellovibrionota bacterium]